MHSALPRRTAPPEGEHGMKHEKLVDILVLVKRLGNLFNELEDVSNQLAEAVDRQDEVSMKMIVAMRYEPVSKLEITDQALRKQLAELGEEGDISHIRSLLRGDESAAQNETETAIAVQAASNIRLHQRIMEQDKILNQKITRDKSIYQ